MPRERVMRALESTEWPARMSETIQDSVWHAEGDVYTHTLMVCDELERLEAWPSLAESEREALMWAGALHDVGKALVTRTDPDTGRVMSPGHSKVSARIARGILRGAGVGLAQREMIANGIALHGWPMGIEKRDDPVRDAVHASHLFRTDLLCWLALADFRGRVSPDAGDESRFDYWRAACDDADCWGKPYAFADSEARFKFYAGYPVHRGYAPYDTRKVDVTMMAGPPGAGKSTWAKLNGGGLPSVSLDALRDELGVGPGETPAVVLTTARERCKEHLRAARSFIFDATNITHSLREAWLGLFYRYGARVRIVYLEPPLEEILRRNAERERQVPEAVIFRMLEKAEPPTVAEAHDILLV